MTGVMDLLRPIPFRGKVRLFSPLLPGRGECRARVFGYQVPLDLSNYIDRMIYLGTFEPLNTYRFRKLLRPGMTVVDVGANIGYFSWLAARKVGPKGRVVALEPHPMNFAVLQAVQKANRIECLTPLQAGLSDANGTARIGKIAASQFADRTASMVDAAPTDPEVPVWTLDELVEKEALTTIDLLKIDVDGFESRILRGARRTLEAGRVRNLIIEFNPFWMEKTGSSAAELTSLITLGGLVDRTGEDLLSGFLLGPSEDRRFGAGR
jgi:FkbM family methyltransferase